MSIATALVVTAFPTAASAQQSSAQEQIEEIIVTASRRQETLQDVALAAAVLDPKEFANAGKTNLSEILPFVPGVVVQNTGGTSLNGVIIRGINAFGGGGISTYIDDVPYGSSTIYSSGGAPIDGMLLDLESLNVLKGPQGTLYGASAMGGLLKFKTRNASLDQWTGSVSTDLSGTRGGGLNQLYRISANGPLVFDRVGLSFTGFWSDKTGFIDNVTIPKEGWDDYEYYGGSGSLLLSLTDELTVKFLGLYQKSTQEGLATIQANGLDDFPAPGILQGEPAFGKYQTGEPDINPSIFETTLFGLAADYDFGWATLTSVSSYQELERSETTDFTIPFAGLADLFFPGNAPHTSALFVSTVGWEKFTQELRLTSKSNEKFEWLIGGFYQDEDGFNTQDLIITPPEPTLFFADLPSAYTEVSFFATGTFYFAPNFDASLGIRYSDTEMSVELETKNSVLVAPLPLNIIGDNVTTYLFNVRYRRSDNMSIYGRVASGFRPGGANILLTDPATGQPITDPRFNADSLWSYELGIKGTTGRFDYDLAAFYIDWSDYQIQVIRGGLQVAGNAEAASSKGAEASLKFAATDALTLLATVSVIDAQLDSDEPDLGGADGEQIPGSPEWSGTLSFNWDFNVGNRAAYLAGSWRYNGHFPVGYPGFTDTAGTFFPPSAPRYDVDSYSILDLRVGFDTKRFETSVYVTNLLDEDAYQYFVSSFTAFSNATPSRPRTVGVVLRAKFD